MPEPVGAAISVSAPAAIAGQPASCAGVGVPKRSANQRATSGENGTATPPLPIHAAPSTGAGRRDNARAFLAARTRPGIQAAVSRKTGRSRQRRSARRRAADGRRARASARAARRRAARPAVRCSPLAPTWLVWGGATLVLFVLLAVALERKITWYLAVDQFGYLTFAHDLLHGRVFHDWPPLDALGAAASRRAPTSSRRPTSTTTAASTAATRPASRILLAGWIGLFGDDAAHYLNPTVYLALLAVALAFQWRLFRSRWRAAAGTALIALFPTMMHLWGLTLTRDLSAHLFGVHRPLPAAAGARAPLGAGRRRSPPASRSASP